jgi:hypothetical protein
VTFGSARRRFCTASATSRIFTRFVKRSRAARSAITSGKVYARRLPFSALGATTPARSSERRRAAEMPSSRPTSAAVNTSVTGSRPGAFAS